MPRNIACKTANIQLRSYAHQPESVSLYFVKYLSCPASKS